MNEGNDDDNRYDDESNVDRFVRGTSTNGVANLGEDVDGSSGSEKSQ